MLTLQNKENISVHFEQTKIVHFLKRFTNFGEFFFYQNRPK